MDIPTAIATITGGIQLGKALVDTSSEIDKAQLKLKIVELVDQLVTAKDSLVDARQEIRALEVEISRLKETADKIGNLVECQGFLYRKDEDEKPVGQPYCPRCREADNALISLQHGLGLDDWQRICPQCKNQFLVDMAARDRENARLEAAMRNYEPPSY